jgi:hypothetical protein
MTPEEEASLEGKEVAYATVLGIIERQKHRWNGKTEEGAAVWKTLDTIRDLVNGRLDAIERERNA